MSSVMAAEQPTDKILLEKRIAGATTVLCSSGTGIYTIGNTIGICAKGSTIIAHVNGSEVSR